MKFIHIIGGLFMIKKLELRHIAPYISHGLMCEYVDTFGYKQTGKLTGMDICFGISVSHCYSDCIPILKPIKDIDTDKLTDYLLGNNSDAINLWVDYFNSDNQNKETAILTAPYPVIEYCFMNHFDVFGLINSKLAIDINTLKND